MLFKKNKTSNGFYIHMNVLFCQFASLYLFLFHMSVNFYLSIYQPAYLSIHLSVYLSIYLSISPSIQRPWSMQLPAMRGLPRYENCKAYSGKISWLIQPFDLPVTSIPFTNSTILYIVPTHICTKCKNHVLYLVPLTFINTGT